MGEGGVKKGQKKSDVFYGRPLTKSKGNLNEIPNIGKRQQSLKLYEEAQFKRHAAKKGFPS